MASLTFALDHRWAPPRMSAYLEGDMGRRGRRRLERHVARCPVCTRHLRVLREVLAGLRGIGDERPAPAPDLIDAVLARLERDDDPPRTGPPHAGPPG